MALRSLSRRSPLGRSMAFDVTSASTATIVRRRLPRFGIALALAFALTWTGTFVLVSIGVDPLVACVLAGVLGLGVLMQTLSPGRGFAWRGLRGLEVEVAGLGAHAAGVGVAVAGRDINLAHPHGRSSLDIVRSEAAAVLGLDAADAIPPDEPFESLGLDSLAAVELRNRLQRVLGKQIAISALFDAPTSSALAQFLDTQRDATADYEDRWQDPVTGLPTRPYLMKRLAELEGAARRGTTEFALVVLQIELPDALEEMPGKGVAPLAADRLSRAVRRGDTVTRIGSSRFAVAVSLSESDRDEVYAAGARIVNAVARASDAGPALQVSLGVVMYEHGMRVGELLRDATSALYAAQSGDEFGVVTRRFRVRQPRRERNT